MKFDQLIEYNMTNIFVEKSYAKRGGETIPRLFSKISMQFAFIVVKPSLRPLTFILYNAF